MVHPATKIAVQPETHPWHASFCGVVERAGGTVSELQDAEALIWLAKTEEPLGPAIHPGLRWVQLRAAGIEHWFETGEIDEERVFTSARGVYSQAVAEHVLALLLAASRRLHVCARSTSWDAQGGGGRMLRGSTVAIIGAGGVGQEVIDCLQPFGVRVIAVTRSGREVRGAEMSFSADQIDEVYPMADYLVLSAPATSDTEALLGDAGLDALPDHAWIINVARGSLVETDALVRALREGRVAGAAVDVTDPEPLPDGHELWTLPNVLITPHVANPKASHQVRLEERVEENVRRFISGDQLLGIVDAAAGY